MSSKTLPKGYEPADVEKRWLDRWDKEKAFTPDLDAEGEPYSLVIPPPNVTGALHMGHAINHTIQDIVCRCMRQKGKKVLWVPGTDHAGIATQNVVERKLAAEGSSRAELGREKFLEQVWEWKEEYGGRILNQMRRLGESVDWSRTRFTMDEGLSKAVREVFVSLYEQGLIYRGEYIINWCTRCGTALADDEVEYSPNKGSLYYIRYPAADGSGELVVATVRPETMLGDTAVAVHPEDERYAHLVGKRVVLPLVGRELPVIADPYVEMEFGTGCLKITPAHDINDWELGRKYELDVVKVIGADGLMTGEAGPDYAGLTVEQARAKIVEKLRQDGWLVDEEEYEHKVSECYRCRTVIEPHVSEQWFVAVQPLAERARKAVEVGETRIHPVSWQKTYYNWLDNIRDWCISRQLWWGHRIPVWYCQSCGKMLVERQDPDACPCGGELVQDPDVLDTWFSSALWPFSTLGWPDQTRDLDLFYPTSLLVTAFDILFFWVARMMMMGLHFMDQVPFRDVYIHALVRDEDGRKMSKSLGNVIDPLEMIERYGCDALRFTLAAHAAMGRDIRLSEARIEGYRHFVNKIWNAARFSLMNLPDAKPTASIDQAEGLHHAWLLSRLETVKAEVDEAVAAYRFNDAAQALYQFTWHEFCDWYLEMVKLDLQDEDRAGPAQAVLWTGLAEIVTMLHPFLPFVTAEIWSVLPGAEPEDLALAPEPEKRTHLAAPDAEKAMVELQELIVAVRTIRGELNIAPSVDLDAVIRTSNEAEIRLVEENAEMIRRLARVRGIEVGPEVSAPRASAAAVIGSMELRVPLEGKVDFQAELARLDKELGKIEKDYAVVQKKLNNEGFLANAPESVVQKEREKLAAMDAKRSKLEKLRERLEESMG
ncbi:valine--tRNA ligase [Desulfohalovibrio reitneri]|uniref:valine--tRNA ligase n=1 Tax=Desulfohalovibrio reitneri TaxID=1307759 RepID=UPI0004A78539|nr:valine--tRNA ligase [Desulfohalovibrio reitneri]